MNRLSGNYEIEFDGDSLPSGIYICRMVANQYVVSIKLLLFKILTHTQFYLFCRKQDILLGQNFFYSVF